MLRERWFERLLGPERDDVAVVVPLAWMRRLSPLESTYTKERAVEVCLETLDASSASTSRTTRISGSTSTTGRRSRRAPA